MPLRIVSASRQLNRDPLGCTKERVQAMKSHATKLLLPGLLGVFLVGAAKESQFSALSGVWVDSDRKLGCTNDPNPHQFSFSDDHSKMTEWVSAPRHGPPGEIHLIGEVSEYQVTHSSPHIRVRPLLSDSPTTLAEWDLVLVSSDRLCWHSTDTPSATCSRSFERCR